MYFKGMVTEDFLRSCRNSRKRRVVSGYSIPEKEIPPLYDSSFYKALEVWNNNRIMGGQTYSGGWAEWPADIVRIIKTIDMAFNMVQNEKTQEARKSQNPRKAPAPRRVRR